jgi:hypothetical protein
MVNDVNLVKDGNVISLLYYPIKVKKEYLLLKLVKKFVYNNIFVENFCLNIFDLD